ncbi:hypothetical protein HGRIS_000388 [Hohenbuehelia grisea]|uniref:UBL3-like ubiquitin domain-containing protein n=1 Tax=Hohenbuehelia grisea TaxID=104357 RepID=A0ABR3JS25_9AGAR
MSSTAPEDVSQPSHEPKLTEDEDADQQSAQPTAEGNTLNGAPANASQSIQVSVPQTPQTYVTFLLVSGRRRTMSFDPATTIGRVKELVWNAWPSEWQDERPPAPAYLRILHLGKILQDEDSLTKLSFPTSLPQAQSAPAPSQSATQASPTSQPSSTESPSATAETQAPSPPAATAPVPPPQATIVHLSIRPYAPPTEDDLKKDKRKSRVGRWARGGQVSNDASADAVGAEPASGVAGEHGEGRSGGCCGCVIC